MIRKNIAVSMTGHRKFDGIYCDINSVNVCKYRDHVRANVISLVTRGYRDFITGCALGSDTLGFYVVEDVRNMPEFINLGIRNILAIPYIGFNSRWSGYDISVFNNMLHLCDEFYVVDQIPYYYSNTPGSKLNKRNMFMVDNSDVLLVINFNGTPRGGTYNCIEYAKRIGKQII